jgi:hypothetical protein
MNRLCSDIPVMGKKDHEKGASLGNVGSSWGSALQTEGKIAASPAVGGNERNVIDLLDRDTPARKSATLRRIRARRLSVSPWICGVDKQQPFDKLHGGADSMKDEVMHDGAS